MDDQDDLDFILSESADEKKARLEAAQASKHDRNRSSADDILDAVGGVSTDRKSKGKCPLCGGATKTRSPGVGYGVKQRKCKDCGHLYAVGMVSRPGAVRRQAPVLPGVGPYFGEGGPPMDRNQPVQRRLAENIRRVKDHES